jgi:hypothetical protein
VLPTELTINGRPDDSSDASAGRARLCRPQHDSEPRVEVSAPRCDQWRHADPVVLYLRFSKVRLVRRYPVPDPVVALFPDESIPDGVRQWPTQERAQRLR